MIISINEGREAARVDHHEEDLLIQSFIDAAGEWISRVTGTPADSAPEDVKQIARMLVAHWYDHRHAASEANVFEVPAGIRTLLATRRSFVRVSPPQASA